MHKYGIITVLPFSNYASPIFAERKPNGKIRLLVDLREFTTLIADDYTNYSHPVSTLSDAAQHLAGNSLFCKLDCSQAYHVLQMADKRSVEMLAFIFACRNFAYKRLAQRLSRAVFAFSGFMRSWSTWTLLLRPTNVISTWMILELQPIMLRILPGTFKQSPSEFARQV